MLSFFALGTEDVSAHIPRYKSLQKEAIRKHLTIPSYVRPKGMLRGVIGSRHAFVVSCHPFLSHTFDVSIQNATFKQFISKLLTFVYPLVLISPFLAK